MDENILLFNFSAHRKLAKTNIILIEKFQPAQLVFSDISSNDIDEITNNMAGWCNDWRQLGPGKSQNQIEGIAGQETVLQKVRLSHSIHQRGITPNQFVTFGFPNKPGQMIWDGREYLCPGMFDFNGKNGYDSVSGKNFLGVTVSFSKSNFSRIAKQLKLSPAQLISPNSPRLLSGQNHALGEFQIYLNFVYNNFSKPRTLKDQKLAMIELDEELPVRLITALAGSRLQLHDQPLKGRQRGLRLAIEFIDEYCQRNPNIPDICDASNLSWRSLDRAFKESFGIGPKRYLLNLRLRTVQRKLKSAPPNTKIADVANSLGFWHMGDFAREYRKMFYELPAETLIRQ